MLVADDTDCYSVYIDVWPLFLINISDLGCILLLFNFWGSLELTILSFLLLFVFYLPCLLYESYYNLKPL